MRFIHIADVHIGARPEAGRAYSFNREREILDSFKRVLEQCENERIELLIIAGGLFHRHPLLQELKEVNYLFSKLSKTKVVFVVGNRDYLRENTYYQSFQWSKNVYPILTENLSCIEIPLLELAIYGCSYHEQEVREKKLLAPIKLANQRFHILLGHGGDETHMPFEVEEMDARSYDYIGLGYRHHPQILSENKIAYAGSLEPICIEDTGKHGFIKGELTVDEVGRKKTNIEFVDFANRKYIVQTVKIDEYMTSKEVERMLWKIFEQYGRQHMYRIELIGKRNIKNLMDRESLDSVGNIVEFTDHTYLYYDMKALEQGNPDNLLGAYIKSFGKVEEGSIEYMALYEGVEAIEETKKG